MCTCVCCVKISRTVFLNSALVARKNRNQTRSTHARDRSFHSTRHYCGVRLIVRKFKLSNLLAPVQSFSLISWFAFHTAKCVCVCDRGGRDLIILLFSVNVNALHICFSTIGFLLFFIVNLWFLYFSFLDFLFTFCFKPFAFYIVIFCILTVETYGYHYR